MKFEEHVKQRQKNSISKRYAAKIRQPNASI